MGCLVIFLSQLYCAELTFILIDYLSLLIIGRSEQKLSLPSLSGCFFFTKT